MTLFSWRAGELLRFFALTVLSVPGFGQAWTPPRGEGAYAMVFQDLYTTKHTFADGSRADVGHVTLLGLANSVDFGVTDKFAATFSFPVGMGIYNGKNPHLLPIDNGNFHGSLQDFGIGLRYNLVSRPVMFTPFVLATMPWCTMSTSLTPRSGVTPGRCAWDSMPDTASRLGCATLTTSSSTPIPSLKNSWGFAPTGTASTANLGTF